MICTRTIGITEMAGIRLDESACFTKEVGPARAAQNPRETEKYVR